MSSPSGPSRVLSVRHETRYRYDRQVARSVHRLHLRPIQDGRQTLLDFRLTIAPEPKVVEFEDVFGNCAAHFELHRPYGELSVIAESTVAIADGDPFAFARGAVHQTFPIAWMPWERLMLHPYLQPVELPETQLKALYDYALSFVERNNYVLLEILFAINLTFFREYEYVPGSTNLETTPYEVYATRRGVCQDFANLFICLARLLGIPARYVCGYVFTGNTSEARARSDASHAWVQVYIPAVGWKDFDPTNGVLPRTDHVRVGYGRHYRDTAPTSGTLFSPAVETMTTDVLVADLGHRPVAGPTAGAADRGPCPACGAQ